MNRKRTLATIVVLAAIAVLAILGTDAVGRRSRETQHRREREMHTALSSMRGAIREFDAKHGRKPRSLEDLVSAGDLRAIPRDPVTELQSTWRPFTEEHVRVDDFQSSAEAGSSTVIVDVHSGAPGADTSGRPWSDY